MATINAEVKKLSENINNTDNVLSSLVDIRDVKIDKSLPTEERIKSYVEQIKNPYKFKVGDVIKEDTHGNEGTVVAIDLIYTRIKTVDNKVIVIPNSVITSSSLTNVTGQSERRLEIRFGIGYQDDIKLAKAIIERIAAEHAKTIDQNPIQVYVDELADSCIYIGMRVWVPTDDYYPIRWDILERVKIEFDKAGINIPYNQLDVHLVKDGE